MAPVLQSPRAATGAELKAHIEAERAGFPFLVFRNRDAQHTIFVLADGVERVALGRSPSADVPLTWDDQVSRVHAELWRIGEEWALVDDGLSLNGSFVNGAVVHGRRRLHDGDTLRVGNTALFPRSERSGLPHHDTPGGAGPAPPSRISNSEC